VAAMISEDEIGQRCFAAAIILSLAHILTIAGTFYQEPIKIDGPRIEQFDRLIPLVLVNGGIFLSPVFVLLLIKRVCILVGIFAIPILTIFALRMHDVWQFYWSGINSMAVQKGDALNFFTILFEMFSAAIVGLLLLGILIWRLIDRLQRARRR
jgi:hypothetical protein